MLTARTERARLGKRLLVTLYLLALGGTLSVAAQTGANQVAPSARRSQRYWTAFTTIPLQGPTTLWELCTHRQTACPAPSWLSNPLSSCKIRTGKLITTWRLRFLDREIEREPCVNCKPRFSRNRTPLAPISLWGVFLKARGG